MSIQLVSLLSIFHYLFPSSSFLCSRIGIRTPFQQDPYRANQFARTTKWLVCSKSSPSKCNKAKRIFATWKCFPYICGGNNSKLSTKLHESDTIFPVRQSFIAHLVPLLINKRIMCVFLVSRSFYSSPPPSCACSMCVVCIRLKKVKIIKNQQLVKWTDSVVHFMTYISVFNVTARFPWCVCVCVLFAAIIFQNV